MTTIMERDLQVRVVMSTPFFEASPVDFLVALWPAILRFAAALAACGLRFGEFKTPPI